MSDPEQIYLAPECCADPYEGRLWCEDDVWSCEDGQQPTTYVRADIVAGLETKLAAAESRCKAMEERIRNQRAMLRHQETHWMAMYSWASYRKLRDAVMAAVGKTTKKLAAAERDSGRLLDALKQRDGGWHDRDCKGLREWGDYVCDCGHEAAQKAIDAAINHTGSKGRYSTEGVG